MPAPTRSGSRRARRPSRRERRRPLPAFLLLTYAVGRLRCRSRRRAPRSFLRMPPSVWHRLLLRRSGSGGCGVADLLGEVEEAVLAPVGFEGRLDLGEDLGHRVLGNGFPELAQAEGHGPGAPGGGARQDDLEGLVVAV